LLLYILCCCCDNLLRSLEAVVRDLKVSARVGFDFAYAARRHPGI
jgi:hypothetical protein